MSETLDKADIVDRIARALPAEIRADYYRELTHCRSLPENDEMLRILRAMQFLTLLMQQVPERVLRERESLEQVFGDALERLHSVVEDSGTYQKRWNSGWLDCRRSLPSGCVPRRLPARSTKTCASNSCNRRFHEPPRHSLWWRRS